MRPTGSGSGSGDPQFGREWWNLTTICRWALFASAVIAFSVYCYSVYEAQTKEPPNEGFITVQEVGARRRTTSPTTTTKAKPVTPQQKDPEMFQYQTNTKLVKEIQTNWLKSPSKLPYNYTLNHSEFADLSSVKDLHEIVLNLLGEKKNGFFIECGAYNGVGLSNTLHLEREYNWTGLLVEADPQNYQQLLQSQRKAWSINACLSVEPRELKVNMTRVAGAPAQSNIKEFAPKSDTEVTGTQFEAQCFPLTSILAALGESYFNVDYFSLDIEGAELQVLQTIPWDYVHIKVISVETFGAGKLDPLVDFLRSKNYNSVWRSWVNDHVFVLKNATLKNQKSNGLK